MRTKVTLVLLFLNVALFFFIFYLRPQWATEERLKEARRHVLGPETINIQSLEIATGGRTVRLVKRGEGWALTQPFDWPALRRSPFLLQETSYGTGVCSRLGPITDWSPGCSTFS